MQRIVLAAVAALVLTPVVCVAVVSIATTLASASTTACTLGSTGPVPSHLTAKTTDKVTVRLDRTQLTHAATIIKTGSRTPGVGRDGVLVALMAALTESSLRMLANTSAWPTSAGFPNDGNGGDHDSLGLFQMRPLAGWGSVADLMSSTYQARAFFGGDSGPNHGSPRGLLDIPAWRSLPKGAAAQAVEVSAFPDRYARFEPVAEKILTELTTPVTGVSTVAEPGRVVFPLPAGTWTATSPYGYRADPVDGSRSLHTGADYAAQLGTPVLAIADGRVVFAGDVRSGYGHLILVQHTVNGRPIYSGYAHVYANGIHVRRGQMVTAGQHIAEVGRDGKSTGPHLHFELRPGGPYAPAIDPKPWLAAHQAVSQHGSSSSENFSGSC